MDTSLPDMTDHPANDWIAVIHRLMGLAREAVAAFEFDRAINYLRTLEEIWDSKELPECSLELRLELHRLLGKALASKGDLEAAITEYKKTLDYCRGPEQLSIKSDTFIQIGQLLGKQGDYDRALGYHQRAIGAYRRLGDSTGLCRALRNLGVIYVELGEFEEAEATYDEAIDLASQMNEEMLYADMVNNLGTIMNMRGNWRRALDLYRESLGIYRSNQEVRKSAYTMNNLAITFAEQGHLDEALRYYENAHETAVEIADASLCLIININLADLHLKEGRIDDARTHCNRAKHHLQENNLRNAHRVEADKIEGMIDIRQGRFDSAMDRLNEAHALAREIGSRFMEAEVLHERGSLHALQGSHFDALTDLEASYEIFRTIRAAGKRTKSAEAIESIEAAYLRVFDAMAQEVDRKDKYTKGHSDRVAALSLVLAKELGVSGSALKTIVAGALLHDLGKLKIEDSILKKAGKLDEQEFRRIRQHPELGVELLQGKSFPWDIRAIILHHHEKTDGNGYPAGLKGETIPLGARLIGITDVFDALTSDRVYREAYTVEGALDIMREESGTSFDPALLHCFEEIVLLGKVDDIIGSKESRDDLRGIWAKCLEDGESVETEERQLVSKL